ncbi:MAG: 30S ribosomal protein S17e, partial [Ignisphaera sp.]
ARKLLTLYTDMFKPEFQYNKELVSKLVSTKSKKLRNQIAGYITHLVKLRERQSES